MSVKTLKYRTSGYTDYVHRMGHFEQQNYFIGTPYNVIVIMGEDSRYDRALREFITKEKLVTVIRSEEPHNKYDETFDRHIESELVEMNVSQEWVDKCMDYLKNREELEKNADVIVEMQKDYKTEEEVASKHFNSGSRILEKLKYSKQSDTLNYNFAIEQFRESAKHKTFTNLSYYNMACGFALMDDVHFSEAVEYLKKAVQSGFINWCHLVTDSDLEKIIKLPEVVELIKEMMTKNPQRTMVMCSYGNKPDCITQYLMDVGLDTYEKELKELKEKSLASVKENECTDCDGVGNCGCGE